MRTSLIQAPAEAVVPDTACATCSGARKTAAKSAAQGSRSDAFAAQLRKVMCPKEKAYLQGLKKRGVKVTVFDQIYFTDAYYDGHKWTTKQFDAAGSTHGKEINMLTSGDVQEDAATLYHEGIHTGQSEDMAWRDKEYDAYTKEEHFRIAHGLRSGGDNFRTASGAVNEPVIKAMVDKEYPGVTADSKSGAAPDEIVGRNRAGQTVVQRADGTTFTRAPKKGDSYPGPQHTVPNGGIPLDLAKVQCP